MSPARAGGGEVGACSAIGPAEPLGGGDGLLARVAVHRLEHRHAVRGEQLGGGLVRRASRGPRRRARRRRSPARARRRRRRTAGAGRAGATASRGGRRRARARGPRPRGSGSSARSSGRARRAARRVRRCTRRPASRRPPSPPRAPRAPRRCSRPDRPGVDDDHRVDAVVVEERADRGEVVLERRAHAEVDRVLDAVGVRQPLGQRARSSRRPARRGRGGASCTRRDAIRPSPPEFVTMPTLRLRGSGWRSSRSAASNSASVLSTRSTPAWRSSASTAASSPSAPAVCDSRGGRQPARGCPSPRGSASAARRGARPARSAAGCRTTRRTARSPCSAGRRPSTRAGRSSRRRRGCRARRTPPRRAARAAAWPSSASPSAPDCDDSARPPGAHVDVAEQRVQRDRRVGVDEAEAVRPDEPHAAGADRLEQRLLALAALGLVGVREARRRRRGRRARPRRRPR